MKEWYYCPECGKKVAQYEPLMAICYGVYVRCRGCKQIIEIKRQKEAAVEDFKDVHNEILENNLKNR